MHCIGRDDKKLGPVIGAFEIAILGGAYNAGTALYIAVDRYR